MCRSASNLHIQVLHPIDISQHRITLVADLGISCGSKTRGDNVNQPKPFEPVVRYLTRYDGFCNIRNFGSAIAYTKEIWNQFILQGMVFVIWNTIQAIRGSKYFMNRLFCQWEDTSSGEYERTTAVVIRPSDIVNQIVVQNFAFYVKETPQKHPPDHCLLIYGQIIIQLHDRSGGEAIPLQSTLCIRARGAEGEGVELPGEAETAGGWFAGYQSPASGGREIARRIVVGSDRDEAERGNRKGK